MCRHLFLLLALGLEACTSESPRSLSEEDRAAIRAAHEERAQAMMKGDAKAAAAVATADGVILPPGLPMREGRGALEEWFSQGRVPSLEFEPLVIEGEGRWAYDRGTFRVTLPDSATRHGKYLWVWRREPGVGWRVHVAMWDWLQKPSQ
jgi:ketosteroid isomerase-like protein